MAASSLLVLSYACMHACMHAGRHLSTSTRARPRGTVVVPSQGFPLLICLKERNTHKRT